MRRHHICAHRGPRPKAVGDIIKLVRSPEICDQMFETKRLFWLLGLFTWIMDRDYMHTLPCYAVP